MNPGTVPSHMSAVVLTGHGGLDRLEHRTDVPVPRPAAGEVLIAVHACALNQTDVNTRLGWYGSGVLAAEDGTDAEPGTWSGTPLRFPLVQGSSIVGRIVGVGDGVAASRTGERVVVDPVVRPADGSVPSFVGSEHDGGYADYVVVPSVNALTAPDGVGDVLLAAAQVSHTTAAEMLLRSRLRAGETVVVTGASGGVGAALVQIATSLGAHVVALTSPARAADVQALGAATVLDRTTDDLAGGLRAAGVERVDVVADVVGGPMFSPLLRLLGISGRYVTGGAIGGAEVDLDLRQLIYRDVDVIGVGSLASDRSVRAVLDHLREGTLEPRIAAVHPLADLAVAQERFLDHDALGRVVVTTPAADGLHAGPTS